MARSSRQEVLKLIKELEGGDEAGGPRAGVRAGGALRDQITELRRSIS